MNNLKTIEYDPAIRVYAGSINAALLVSYLEVCFKEKGKCFNKFLEPCGHSAYQVGESCVEELQMTATEFRTAFKHVGVVYKSKKEYNVSKEKFQGKMYLSYYDRISKLTYYMRNDELADRRIGDAQAEKVHEVKEAVKVDIVHTASQIDEIEQVDAAYKSALVECSDRLDTANSIWADEVSRNEETEDVIIDHMTNKLMTNDSKTNKSLSDLVLNKNNHSVIETKTIVNQDLTQTVPFEAIKQLFNQICQFHEPISSWNGWQKQKLAALWEKYEQDLEAFKTVFSNVAASDFLSGRIKAWKAELGWLLTPSHFADVLRGRYMNFQRSAKEDLVAQGMQMIQGSSAAQETQITRNSPKAQSIQGARGIQPGQIINDRMLCHDWDFEEIERLEQRRIDAILAISTLTASCS